MSHSPYSAFTPQPGFFPLLFAACLLSAFFLLPAQGFCSSPLDAIKQMQRGVDQSDSDLFNQAIDVDSVVNKASSTLLAALREQAASGNLADSNITMILGMASMAEGSGQAAFVKQMLVSEVKSFLVAGVNGGYFAGKPNGRVKASGMSLASTLEKMPPGRREIIPGKMLSNEKGLAEVSATFVDPEAGRLPLKLALEQRGGQWKVVEILNAAQVFKQVSKK